MSKNLFLIIAFLFSAASSVAQRGNIVGQIVDAETGEELIGATVFIKETSKGGITDLTGNYIIQSEPGVYTLNISYVSYTSQTIENVRVNPGESTSINIALSSNIELEEVIISAEAIKENDVGLLKIQKKSLAVQDGISAMSIKRIGASNAAESMTQVTGASVEGGKYIVMRGLGDRYSLTQMNGVTLPSADPYRNSTSLDMIPADMIESIVTVKTFNADQPGNFTGGKVDVTTKTLPDDYYFNFAMKMGFNTQASFIDNFLRDGTRSSTDWLGYDNGTRSRPVEFDQYNEFIRKGEATTSAILGQRPEFAEERNALDATSKALKNDFVARNTSSFTDWGINFAIGNRFDLGTGKIGVNFGFKYDRSYNYFENGTSGLYTFVNSDSLQVEQDYTNRVGVESAMVGALLALGYQINPNNEIVLNVLYNHSGDFESSITSGFWRETASDRFTSYVTALTERELANSQLLGRHFFQSSKIKLDWSVGYVLSTQDEPDLRMFGFTNDFNPDNTIRYGMNRSIVGRLPTEFFRDLTDEQYNAKVDVTIPVGSKNNEIKIGGLYSDKNREFNEYDYSFNSTDLKGYHHPDHLLFADANGDLDAFFSLDNRGNMGLKEPGGDSYGFGNIYTDQTQIGNFYTGNETIGAGYILGVFDLSTKLKSVLGIRTEYTDISAASRDTTKLPGKIDKMDYLPSINLIYNLSDRSKLRFAYSNTIARPNMREISPFASVGGVGRDIVLGNPELQRTFVYNFDLRYEIYPKGAELFAVSLYYKSLENPIVWQLTPKASTPEIRPINSETANVAGFEIELRKQLDFISPALSGWTFSTNASIIYSRVDKGEEELEILRREQSLGRALNQKEWRPFYNQSPYIINFVLSQYSTNLKWENTLSFNIWGQRLSYVTGATDPDVYERPRPSLNFVSRKDFGKRTSLSLKVKNLLNMNFRQVYDFDRASGFYVFENFQQGVSVDLGLSFRFD